MGSNWEFHHVGVIVKDMDKTVDYYQSLGIATFRPEHMFDASTFTEFKLYGKTPDAMDKHRGRFMQIGPVAYELLQPVSGESIHDEFFNDMGEGIEHIGYTVDDLEAETTRLAEKGIPAIVSGRRKDGGGYAYFDLRKNGGNVIIELMQRRKNT